MKLLALALAFLSNACTTLRPTSVREFDNVTVKVMSDEGGGGTGVVFRSTDKGTVILTNAHICEAIQTGGKVLYNGAHAIKRYKPSKVHDICFLFIEENLYVNTVLSKSAPPRYSKIYISGHPHLYPHVVSEGYVSGTGRHKIGVSSRPCTKLEEEEDPVTCIFEGATVGVVREATLMSALISPGSSGSGVFNTQGELVGLAFAAHGELGYALVVPWKYLDNFVKKEAKELKWEIPGPDHKTPEYVNGGMDDIENWQKLIDLLDKRKQCLKLCP